MVVVVAAATVAAVAAAAAIGAAPGTAEPPSKPFERKKSIRARTFAAYLPGKNADFSPCSLISCEAPPNPAF